MAAMAVTLFMSCMSEIPEGNKNDFDKLPQTKVNVDDYVPKQFTHPGILHTTARLDQMKAIIKDGANSSNEQVKLAYKAWTNLTADKRAKANYGIRNAATEKNLMLARGNGGNTGMFQDDFSAAYMNALEWALTGNMDNGNKAKEILLKYANTVAGLTVNNDTPLLAGLQGFEIAYAAELLSTYGNNPMLTGDDLQKVTKMLKDYFVPVIDNFYNTPAYTNGNWGLIVSKAYMAMAILFNDTDMYKKAMNFLLFANDNGTLYYIDKETGQCQEQGRDMGHAQLGVGMIGSICEVAYQQGIDLYSFNGSAVEKGFEYIAGYNLGNDMPYKQWQDVTGKYSGWKKPESDGASTRGKFRSIYSLGYNHYVTRKGGSMPYTLQVLEKPNNAECNYDSDNIGFYAFQFCDATK